MGLRHSIMGGTMGTININIISEVLVPLEAGCHFCGQIKFIEFSASTSRVGSYMCRDCRHDMLVSSGLESEVNEKAVELN